MIFHLILPNLSEFIWIFSPQFFPNISKLTTKFMMQLRIKSRWLMEVEQMNQVGGKNESPHSIIWLTLYNSYKFSSSLGKLVTKNMTQTRIKMMPSWRSLACWNWIYINEYWICKCYNFENRTLYSQITHWQIDSFNSYLWSKNK